MHGRMFADYGDNTCFDDKKRKVLQTTLTKWIDIATTLNITYFLIASSLLGAWRNEEAAPYDHDMDILVPREEFYKLDLIKDKRNFTNSNRGKLYLIWQEDWKKNRTR